MDWMCTLRNRKESRPVPRFLAWATRNIEFLVTEIRKFARKQVNVHVVGDDVGCGDLNWNFDIY